MRKTIELRKPDIAFTTAEYFVNPGPQNTPTKEDAELFFSPQWLQKSRGTKNDCKAAEEHHECVFNHRARHKSPYPKFRRKEITWCYRKTTLDKFKNTFFSLYYQNIAAKSIEKDEKSAENARRFR